MFINAILQKAKLDQGVIPQKEIVVVNLKIVSPVSVSDEDALCLFDCYL